MYDTDKAKPMASKRILTYNSNNKMYARRTSTFILTKYMLPKDSRR